ncbi:DUF2247 family protein [Lacrimispora sp. JR3]|uniref:DUF2247 family protein n=1 Tax=Lacrimispora sinapis TaxID=3111456 RepID=UPI003747FFD4
MKVTLNMMSLSGVQYSWATIYTALINNLMENTEVEIYAIELMESDDYKENDFINNLAWGGLKKEEIISSIITEKLIPDLELFEEIELKKIRYAILFYLKEEYKNSKEYLLKKIAEVYADFNYPIEMNDFIYYMPNDKAATFNNQEDAENNLLSNFYQYLEDLQKSFK